MVSAGLKGDGLSIKHLVKTFYFVLSFHFIKPNLKIWRSFANKDKPFDLAPTSYVLYTVLCGVILF